MAAQKDDARVLKWNKKLLFQVLVWVAVFIVWALVSSSLGVSRWVCIGLWMAAFLIWCVVVWGSHGVLFGVLVSPKILLGYRGKTVGAVEGYTLPQPGRPGSVRVRYEAEDGEHVVEREVGTIEMFSSETDYWVMADVQTGQVTDVWDAPELGHVCVGGEIRVRYRTSDPADAVLLPNRQR